MKRSHPAWLFDESVQVGVDYSDAGLVADYDAQHERFRDFAREAADIAAALALHDDATLLDIGCGTGGLTTRLAEICRHVYAVDVSAAMLAVLNDKLERQGLRNVTTVQAGFLSYAHRGEAFDAIVSNINLHHLPDFWKQLALCRFHDLLKPGGRLFLADVVFDFEPRQADAEIATWVAEMRAAAGDTMADEIVVHVRDEFSTWDWIMTGLLERAGFTVDVDYAMMPHMRAYVCTK